MDYCHKHNLVDSEDIDAEKKYGIKVSLPPGDTLSMLIGDDWNHVHWYASEIERDQAYDEMARRHMYYRDTDQPSQVLEKIHR